MITDRFDQQPTHQSGILCDYEGAHTAVSEFEVFNKIFDCVVKFDCMVRGTALAIDSDGQLWPLADSAGGAVDDDVSRARDASGPLHRLPISCHRFGPVGMAPAKSRYAPSGQIVATGRGLYV